MAYVCVGRTHPGLKRKVNEDSLLVRTERGLWAVADGMGGHEAGDVASAKAVEALSLVPPHARIEATIADAVSALRQVNAELIDLARSMEESATVGTTIVGLVIQNGEFGCFWAGDSRAYRLRDGEIARLTRDHSLVQGLVDAGMLDPADAKDHPNANIVTRAIGATESLEVDTSGGEVQPGDVFILASDGLTKVVSEDEIYAALMGSPVDEAADWLVQTVLDRGGPDNVTLVAISVT